MDYELALFKAMKFLRSKHPHIYLTLDITDICLKDVGEKLFIESSFDTQRGRYSIEISHHALATLDVENVSSMIHYSVLHIVYGNVLVDKEKLESAALMSIAQDAVVNEEIPLFKNYKNEPELGVPILLEHISPKLNSRQHTSNEVYNYLYELYKDNMLPQPIMALLIEMESEDGEENEDGEKSSSKKASGEEGSEESDEEGESEDGKESDSKKDSKESRKGKLSVIGSHKKHGKPKDSDGKDKNGQSESLSELQKNIAQSLVNNLVSENQEKFMGSQSASIKRLIDEMKKAEYDFKKLFEMAVKRSINSEKKSTWMRQNRRFGSLAKGYKPRPIPKVLLLVDLSGSIGSETIKMVNWMIYHLATEFDFDVCWGDTKLEGFAKVKKGDKVVFPFVGGGGTDLNFFEPLEREHNYDLIVFATDGYIPRVTDTPSQKIFCIYERGKEVPGYESIFINPFA